MPKCVNCGSSKFELWSLTGRLEDVERDGSSLVCKDCGRMQPDQVLREMVAEVRRKIAEKTKALHALQQQKQELQQLNAQQSGQEQKIQETIRQESQEQKQQEQESEEPIKQESKEVSQNQEPEEQKPQEQKPPEMEKSQQEVQEQRPEIQ